MTTIGKGKRRGPWSLVRGAALAAALVAGATFSFTSASLADTQNIDGDLGSNTPNLMYGAGHNDCSTLGTSVSAALKLHYDGNPNDPSAHFGAGTAVSLSFADRNTGNGNHDALAAGITASQSDITASPSDYATIPSTWNQSSPDALIPFTVTVPSTIADGTYQLEVAASGTDGNGASYSPQGGRPMFIIHVSCASPGGGGGGSTNQPPTASISGDATANEGDTKTYSVTASDPENDPLSISWSITAGNAEIVGDNTGTSVSVHFTDGPSTVGLQVEVSDGNNPAVTPSKSIDEANVAPTVSTPSGDTAVTESTTAHTYTYSISDPGDDTQTGNPSCGSLGTLSAATNTATGGSFDCTFKDGLKPATASDVSVSATDSDTETGNTEHLFVTVSNVAPSITSFTGTSSLAGPLVFGSSSSFTTNFSDPGVIDNPWTAFYSWSDGGSYIGTVGANGSTTHTSTALHSFAAPGCNLSQSVTVSDKDGDSDTESTSVDVGSAGWLPPITNQSVSDKLKNGQVLPVKLYVKDCAGVADMSLTPVIQLVKGDQTAANDDGTDVITISSVSAADTGTYMRAADGFYIYNLRVSVASSDLGKDFTIIVRPYGTSSSVSVRHVIIPTK
jgi:uncharacterized membrane protein